MSDSVKLRMGVLTSLCPNVRLAQSLNQLPLDEQDGSNKVVDRTLQSTLFQSFDRNGERHDSNSTPPALLTNNTRGSVPAIASIRSKNCCSSLSAGVSKPKKTTEASRDVD
jgi:hypothetical protein